jgi:uncharacterized membrane protein YkvA (DUF1232 family)
MQILAKLKQRARQLKAEAKVLIEVYKDVRTPLIAKMVIAVTVGYLLSPIDLIPDFIPVLGLLDDLILIPVLISLSFKLIPQHIIAEAKDRIKNDTKPLKKSNWLFAVVIIGIWILLLYVAFRYYNIHPDNWLKGNRLDLNSTLIITVLYNKPNNQLQA